MLFWPFGEGTNLSPLPFSFPPAAGSGTSHEHEKKLLLLMRRTGSVRASRRRLTPPGNHVLPMFWERNVEPMNPIPKKIRNLRMRWLPPVSRRKALCIAREFVGHDLEFYAIEGEKPQTPLSILPPQIQSCS